MSDTMQFETRPADRAIHYVGCLGRDGIEPGDTVVLRLDDDAVDVRAVHVQVAKVDGSDLTGHIVRAAAMPDLAERNEVVCFTEGNIFRCTVATAEAA